MNFKGDFSGQLMHVLIAHDRMMTRCPTQRAAAHYPITLNEIKTNCVSSCTKGRRCEKGGLSRLNLLVIVCSFLIRPINASQACMCLYVHLNAFCLPHPWGQPKSSRKQKRVRGVADAAGRSGTERNTCSPQASISHMARVCLIYVLMDSPSRF